jgi:hypothetical protein
VSKPTLTITPTSTFPGKIELNVPGVLQGFISVDFAVMSPPEFKEFTAEDLTADEQLRRVVRAVRGMPSDDGQRALEGDEAIEACVNGRFAMWIKLAIVEFFFSQYGEARVKNSPRSRGR